MLAGCAAQYGGPSGYYTGPGGTRLPAPGEGGSRGSGQKVALLVPVTGTRADLGQILTQAAQLALPQGNGPTLDVLDTAGTATGAAAAAQTAIKNGDVLILGPLTSAETAAVAPIAKAAGIPVLAFTNDASQSQPGVWPIGITPAQQVRRLVAAAQGQSKTNFAALLPDSDFGRAMADALRKETAAAGLSAPNIRMHGGGMQAITAAARDVSGYASRRGPIDAQIKEARALGTPEGRHEAAELQKSAIPPPSFDALLLADTGESLQEIASVLPYYDINRSAVQMMGPGLWASPASGSASMNGGWYAAPDSSARSGLEQSFAAKYGSPPPAVADLAFDAASIARTLSGGRGFDVGALTQPAGFVGADGWLAFTPDGKVRRGLAVYKIDHGGAVLMEPAPQSAGGPGV